MLLSCLAFGCGVLVPSLDCLSRLALALLSPGSVYVSLLEWFPEILTPFMEMVDKDINHLWQR
jgi:hypothetical protein